MENRESMFFSVYVLLLVAPLISSAFNYHYKLAHFCFLFGGSSSSFRNHFNSLWWSRFDIGKYGDDDWRWRFNGSLTVRIFLCYWCLHSSLQTMNKYFFLLYPVLQTEFFESCLLTISFFVFFFWKLSQFYLIFLPWFLSF